MFNDNLSYFKNPSAFIYKEFEKNIFLLKGQPTHHS